MTEKILIIADEPHLLEMICRVIEAGLVKPNSGAPIRNNYLQQYDPLNRSTESGSGPELICFTDGREALRWCRQEDPDVVVVDYLMPVMNGLEFISRFRKIPAKEEVPVIMFTGVQDAELRYQALELGAHDLINKPIDNIEFLLRLTNLLTLSRNRKKLLKRASRLNEKIRKASREILKREEDMIIRFSKAAEYRELEIEAHIMRVAHYSKNIAKGLGLSPKEQYLLFQAAPLHDIGKVGIPDRILQKPTNLNKEEYELMKQHTIIGHKILDGSSSELLRTAAEIALTHHERYNGSGYPRGLFEDAIPLYGRIVAIADVFDALTTKRRYKKVWDVNAAFEYIGEKSGKHFDPSCVKVFLSQKDKILAIMENYHDN